MVVVRYEKRNRYIGKLFSIPEMSFYLQDVEVPYKYALFSTKILDCYQFAGNLKQLVSHFLKSKAYSVNIIIRLKANECQYQLFQII